MRFRIMGGQTLNFMADFCILWAKVSRRFHKMQHYMPLLKAVTYVVHNVVYTITVQLYRGAQSCKVAGSVTQYW